MEELKNLFSYRETTCDTHDLLDCPCDGNGILVDRELLSDEPEEQIEEGFIRASQYKVETKKYTFDALHEFWHFDPHKWKQKGEGDICDVISDDILRQVVEKHNDSKDGGISYLFGVKKG